MKKTLMMGIVALSTLLGGASAEAYERADCSDTYFRMDHPRYCGVHMMHREVHVHRDGGILGNVARGVGGLLEGVGRGVGAILSVPFGGPYYYEHYYVDAYGRRHYHKHRY